MKRLILVVGLLAVAGCVDTGPAYFPTPAANSGYPVHPDPLCFYDEPFEPGGPLSEVCA